MNKLFLSALFFAGMIVAIVSCNQREEDQLFQEVGSENLNDVFAQAKSLLPASMLKYVEQGEQHFAELQTEAYFSEADAKAIIPTRGLRVVAGRTGTTTWTNDFIYVLSGPVVVGNGDVLTIQEGTVIKALPGQTTRSSFIVVDRGGQIIADGTEELPIVFTSIADRVRPGEIYPETRPLPPGVRGLWGGVIVLGRATNNNVSTGGVANIEGIQPGGAVPFQHGGTDDTDNSGVIRYVSIRHGGTEIGNGNEINGLTLGSVGNGTTIDFVEVISNRDDGVEWFGGTVNTKHLITAFCGDDAFDWDLGFRGKGQFWFAFQEIVGDAAGELDGGVGNNECSAPFSAPVVANVTFKGNGNTEASGFFDNSAGQFWRSLFVDHREGVRAEDRDAYGTLSAGSDPATCGCDDRIDEGSLAFVDNVFWNVQDNVRADLFRYAGAGDRSGLSFTDSTTNTVIGDPLFGTGKVENGDVFECVPSSGITLFETGLATLIQDPFFEDTNYAGAFTPSFQGNVTASWASRWTMWSFVFANPGGNLGPGTGTESGE